MDNAAHSGELRTVRRLEDNRTEGCSIRAFECAGQASHVDVLEFLRLRYPEVFGRTTDHTFEGAQHTRTLHWLKQHYPRVATLAALGRFVQEDNLEAAMWIIRFETLISAVKGRVATAVGRPTGQAISKHAVEMWRCRLESVGNGFREMSTIAHKRHAELNPDFASMPTHSDRVNRHAS
ncbi:hypothetical protein HK105_201212 [Polyrhizophydium stewartii]|uniref:Uncharacterized protein n=1 Tax=Polyrhizophydium stewartii TaxID=2732419 RepID=A0ABR4NHK7_9FUNG